MKKLFVYNFYLSRRTKTKRFVKKRKKDLISLSDCVDAMKTKDVFAFVLH